MQTISDSWECALVPLIVLGLMIFQVMVILACTQLPYVFDNRYLPPYEDIFAASSQSTRDSLASGNSAWSNLIKPDALDTKNFTNFNMTYLYRPNWPNSHRKLGAASAVSLDRNGNVVIFHRADRVWTAKSFNLANEFLEKNLGAITGNTIIAFDRKAGNVSYECGRDFFFMPHGLFVDQRNNIWVTDVALHQVFKLAPKCLSEKPLLVLGTAFTPGSGKKFCKPTAVAVLDNGDFFVADGYCNSRIIKFSNNGAIILSWGENSFQGDAHELALPNFFAIPHALTLALNESVLCVADRENGRVQCFYTGNGTFHSQYHSSIIGDRLFAVDYAPLSDGILFVINGPEHRKKHQVRGYVVDINTQKIISIFAPNESSFSNPHDIAVTKDGAELFVAELDPPRIHKFESTTLNAKTVLALKNETVEVTGSFTSVMNNASLMSSTVFIVSTATLFVAFLIMTIFLIASKKGRKGNMEVVASSDVEYSKLMSRSTYDEC